MSRLFWFHLVPFRELTLTGIGYGAPFRNARAVREGMETADVELPGED